MFIDENVTDSFKKKIFLPNHSFNNYFLVNYEDIMKIYDYMKYPYKQKTFGVKISKNQMLLLNILALDTSNIVNDFQKGPSKEYYHSKFVRNLDVWRGENFGISPLSKKKAKRMNHSLSNLLLFCNHLTCFDDFSFLNRENKMVFTRDERDPLN